MSNDAAHFILTRFNVRMAMYEHPPDGWLSDRLRLFEKYCVPSFLAQSCPEFRWLIFLDSHSPEWLADDLSAMTRGIADLVPVEGLFTRENAAQAVQGRSEAPHVITTRVDNDDAVATDFVATIQAQFEGQDLEVVNLVNGAQYSERKVYLRPYTRNPFISLIEARSSEAPRTVFARRHYEIDQVGPVRDVRTKHPMWLQVVHGDNVLTERVGMRAGAGRVVPHFACELETHDTVPSLALDMARDSGRIAARLARKPNRIVDLYQAVTARAG